MGQIEKLAAKHLGQNNTYIDQYDPTLLVKIPRHYNRTVYGIDEQHLPFVGTDVWNAYEVSVLTEKGLPVNGVLKIIVPADSACIVESKSLKLYLNSFNMTRLGHNIQQCVQQVTETIEQDLSRLLEIEVRCQFQRQLSQVEDAFAQFKPLADYVDLDQIDFNHDKESVVLQTARMQELPQLFQVQTDLLRSNCRVTHQPDWGDLYIHIESNVIPCWESLARYVVSHRKLDHFHEEVAEMVYIHLQKAYAPEALMVACLYTRRGGIDINPIRASHEPLIPRAFKALELTQARTIRQ